MKALHFPGSYFEEQKKLMPSMTVAHVSQLVHNGEISFSPAEIKSEITTAIFRIIAHEIPDISFKTFCNSERTMKGYDAAVAYNLPQAEEYDEVIIYGPGKHYPPVWVGKTQYSYELDTYLEGGTFRHIEKDVVLILAYACWRDMVFDCDCCDGKYGILGDPSEEETEMYEKDRAAAKVIAEAARLIKLLSFVRKDAAYQLEVLTKTPSGLSGAIEDATTETRGVLKGIEYSASLLMHNLISKFFTKNQS